MWPRGRTRYRREGRSRSRRPPPVGAIEIGVVEPGGDELVEAANGRSGNSAAVGTRAIHLVGYDEPVVSVDDLADRGDEAAPSPTVPPDLVARVDEDDEVHRTGDKQVRRNDVQALRR